jgi:Tfp pilus assembly protein PilP
MKKISYFLIFLLIVFFAGCKDATLTQKKRVRPKPKPVVKVTPESLPKKEEFKVEQEVYDYYVKGRRDPFKPLIRTAKEKPKKREGAPPMETFDVEEVKLVAIAWDRERYYAMITLPDNKSYTIMRGMTLGLYGGKVQEITASSVLIRERRRNVRGELKTIDTILKLREEEGE